MKIKLAAIDSPRDAHDVRLAPIETGLSIWSDAPAELRSSAARLLAETLYGVRFTHYERVGVEPAGHVEVAHADGRYQLRRRFDERGAAHYTISALEGAAASGGTLSEMLAGLSPEVAATVFYANAHTVGDVRPLLSERVASELQRFDGQQEASSEFGRDSIDHLVARRDQIASEIEHRLSDRRRVSDELHARRDQIDGQLQQIERRSDEVVRTLRGVEAELATVESALRYRALAEEAEQAADREMPEGWRPQLDELETQIDHWRKTLADLQRREAEVRGELSTIHPDDAQPSLPLADQRAGLAVAKRLVEDLESEVARLARSAASEVCVCQDAHPRLNPLVDMLGRQLTKLVELSGHQQRALDVQALTYEARHLARSQDELRQQIDHLIDRRQAALRATRTRRDEAITLVEYDAEQIQRDNERRVELVERQRELEVERDDLAEQIRRLSSERDGLTDERSGLLSEASLDGLHHELDTVRRQISSTRARGPVQTTSETRFPWRASEWLAKLSDGRLPALRLNTDGRSYTVVDASGREHAADALSASDRRMVAISLRLAIVAGFARQGARLPLVLDEPFAELDDRQAAILANVLDDFGRLGGQVLVFTGDRRAAERFRALATPSMVGQAHRVAPVVETPPRETFTATTRTVENSVERSPTPRAHIDRSLSHQATQTSEYLLAPEDSIDRFPTPMVDRSAVFARSRICTIGDLLSADPSAVAEELDRDDISAELVALWQTHAAMVCFVPGLSFEDASVLTSAGIFSHEELAEAEEDDIDGRVSRFLQSDRGSRYRSRGYQYDRSRARDWVSRSRRGRERWRRHNAWDGWRRHRDERRQWLDSARSRTRTVRRSSTNSSTRSSSRSSRNGAAKSLRVHSGERRSERKSSRSSRKRQAQRNDSRSCESRSSERELKFYLEIDSPVVDAPSIGPKMAARLERAGVRTVQNLLDADAAVLAESLDHRRVDAETIVAWQHQAQLVCRVPQIRGHDAQILVACGFTTPEELASMKPAELLEFVEPFCDSSEGQSIIRGGKEPDLDEVTDWIGWAGHCRVLGAA